jgi:DNA-binding YbaB/EbfC family protein
MNANNLDIMKNAQKLQEQMKGFQVKLGTITVTGSAGGGMAEVDLNGRMEVLAVRLAPETASDLEMIQDLTAAAFTSAMEKVKEAVQRELGAMTGGLGIPPGLIPGFPA